MKTGPGTQNIFKINLTSCGHVSLVYGIEYILLSTEDKILYNINNIRLLNIVLQTETRLGIVIVAVYTEHTVCRNYYQTCVLKIAIF